MEVFKKINRHFKKIVFDWNYKFYFLVGGYGSGKSYHIALKIILKLMEEKRTCLVVREVFETIRESCYSLFLEIVDSLNLDDYIIFTRSPLQMIFQNGSRIIFRGLDKPSKLKSINDISLIWIEESSEIKYAAFKQLLGRLRHPSLKLHMILSTNPTSTSNWTYGHFFKNKNVDDKELYVRRVIETAECYYHHSTADDNKFLPEDYLAELEKMKAYDPDLYRIARLGQFGVSGVRVLPQFSIMPHNEVMKIVNNIPRRYKFVGLDFGYEVSYNAVVRVAIDHENKYLYIYWDYYRNHETDDELAEHLEDAGFTKTREVIRCDSASPKSIRYLQKRGLNAIACKKWSEGHRQATLYNLRKIKRFKHIICSDACTNVIAELAELTYAVDKDGNIIENELSRDVHTLDATIYSLDTYDVVDIKYSVTKSDFGL